jgi:TonB family protein
VRTSFRMFLVPRRFILLLLLAASAVECTGLAAAQEPQKNTESQDEKIRTPTRIRVGGNVASANLINQVMPVYPEVAKTAHISGTVMLHAVISKDGSIETLEFISGPPLLMKSAMDAVRQWRYKPTTLNGRAVEVDTTISVVYTLENKNPVPPAESAMPPALPQNPSGISGFEGTAANCPGDGLVRVLISPKAQAARLKEKREPAYPEEAKKAGIEGVVLFHAIIAKDGSIEELTLEDGDPLLAKAAEEAVRKWRYEPLTYEDRPAEVDTAIAVEFKLPH